MQKSTPPETGSRQDLDSMIEDDLRYEVLKRWICRLLVLTIVAFIVWAIYFIHIVTDYRLTITLR